jgi:hypothetical protein
MNRSNCPDRIELVHTVPEITIEISSHCEKNVKRMCG